MGNICLVTGGARSGKSSFAEERLWDKESMCYIATGVIENPDAEWEERVEKHRKRRPKYWDTVEQFEQLAQLFEQNQYDYYLLDCATMLTTNLLFKYVLQYYPSKIELSDTVFLTKPEQEHINELLLNEWRDILNSIQQSDANCVIVTNEVGLGIVPDNRLGRFYRDLQGRVNQLIAKEAEEVHLVICGLSQQLK